MCQIIMLIATLKIEIPVLGLTILPHDENWQPDRRFWSGHTVKDIPWPMYEPRHKNPWRDTYNDNHALDYKLR